MVRSHTKFPAQVAASVVPPRCLGGCYGFCLFDWVVIDNLPLTVEVNDNGGPDESSSSQVTTSRDRAVEFPYEGHVTRCVELAFSLIGGNQFGMPWSDVRHREFWVFCGVRAVDFSVCVVLVLFAWSMWKVVIFGVCPWIE